MRNYYATEQGITLRTQCVKRFVKAEQGRLETQRCLSVAKLEVVQLKGQLRESHGCCYHAQR